MIFELTMANLISLAGLFLGALWALLKVIALQAVEQFVLYTGVRPDAALVNEAAAFARAG